MPAPAPGCSMSQLARNGSFAASKMRASQAGRHPLHLRRQLPRAATLVQCRGGRLWQVASTATFASAPDGGSAASKANFYCEQCRVALADPYKEPAAFRLTAKLCPTGARATASNGKIEAVVGVDRTFKLDAAEKRAIQAESLHLYVCCMLLDDTTGFRFHWPLYAELRVNNVPYRVYSRSSSTKLGANGRDNLFSVGRYCYEGSNRVVLTGVDPRPFALLIFTARTRSMEDVKGLMLRKESLAEAHARVTKLIRHGDGGGGDSDDDEIECLSTVISLKCPLTGMRVKTPARFADVSGLNVFDLDAFLDMAQKTYKWQCPQTMKNSSIEQLQVDAYIERALALLAPTPFTEIEVSPEGLWRPAGTAEEFRDIQQDLAAAKPFALEEVKEETLEMSSDEEDGMRAAAGEMAAANGKTQAAKADDSDVIIIISDSDDEDIPVVSSRQPPAPAVPAAQSASRGMRIVLPARTADAGRGLLPLVGGMDSALNHSGRGGMLQQQRPSGESADFDRFMQQRVQQSNGGYLPQTIAQQQPQFMGHLQQQQQQQQQPSLFVGQQQQQQQQRPPGMGYLSPHCMDGSMGGSLLSSQGSQYASYDSQQSMGMSQPSQSQGCYTQMLGGDASQASTFTGAGSMPCMGMGAGMPMMSQGFLSQDSLQNDYAEVLEHDMSGVMDFMALLADPEDPQ
eukprot:jgi/Tetstr1/435617/TSEL_024519.t1